MKLGERKIGFVWGVMYPECPLHRPHKPGTSLFDSGGESEEGTEKMREKREKLPLELNRRTSARHSRLRRAKVFIAFSIKMCPLNNQPCLVREDSERA